MDANKEERRGKIIAAKRAQKERELAKKREIEDARHQEEERQKVLARIREAQTKKTAPKKKPAKGAEEKERGSAITSEGTKISINLQQPAPENENIAPP